MHYKKKKGRSGLIVLAVVLVILTAGSFVLLRVWPGGEAPGSEIVSPALSTAPEEPVSLPPESGTGFDPAAYTALPLPDELRAMWITYPDWENVDISTEAKMRDVAARMFDNCVATGLNTVLVHVRPFGDAMYKSDLFPWSHLLTGTQGQDPGYDPLEVLVEEAHARGLRFEAMINPYRVQLNPNKPAQLAEENPAVQHPGWVLNKDGLVVYNPGLPQVRQLVIDGVAEIVRNYAVDGIHFDDYFYVTMPMEKDAATYAEYGGDLSQDNWRRENNNQMVSGVYAAIKETNPTVSFGISTEGTPANNFRQQYIDHELWMKEPGYVDYLMPQLYWGFDYEGPGGSTDAAFDKITATWARLPRHEGLRLYAGLGLYRIGLLDAAGSRIGFGAGGEGDQSEWESGHAMADQVEYLRQVEGFSGFALFRYDFLYNAEDPLSVAENSALTTLLQSG